MTTTTDDDREPHGFIVVDYAETPDGFNPQGFTVFGPATPQACGRYKASHPRNPRLEVERAYMGAGE